MKLSFIVEFQLVPFAFSLILGDPFMASPPSPKVWGRGTFFQEKLFMGEQILGGKFIGGGLLYMGELLIRSCQEGRSFTKCIFQ